MKRRIIHIDESKCDGCGLCAAACHEGAIEIIDGVAKLTREDYCDGLGDCLPACPTGAITFEEREAPAYDEAAVKAAQAAKRAQGAAPAKGAAPAQGAAACGCPGSQARTIVREAAPATGVCGAPESRLTNWPVQIKLAPVRAPYFDGAHLLVAADCTAFAYGDFHSRFMKGKVTLVGCPKLDGVDYTGKLAQIMAGNDIKSLTIVRMQVPCCGGLQMAAQEALRASGKFIPWQVVTISTDGRIIE